MLLYTHVYSNVCFSEMVGFRQARGDGGCAELGVGSTGVDGRLHAVQSWRQRAKVFRDQKCRGTPSHCGVGVWFCPEVPAQFMCVSVWAGGLMFDFFLQLPEAEQKPYTSQPLWYLGFSGVIIGAVADCLALSLAAQSIVAPVCVRLVGVLL